MTCVIYYCPAAAVYAAGGKIERIDLRMAFKECSCQLITFFFVVIGVHGVYNTDSVAARDCMAESGDTFGMAKDVPRTRYDSYVDHAVSHQMHQSAGGFPGTVEVAADIGDAL